MTTAVLFLDRDGTLIEEPPDCQVDALAKVRFMPHVFAALNELTRQGFTLVIVTNQNGIGSATFPKAAFEESHEFMLRAFESQGIRFARVFICPHLPEEGCECRKPQTALLDKFLRDYDIDRNRSAVIGDRPTDLELAQNIGIRGLTVRRHGTLKESWPEVVRALLNRRAEISRSTRETHIVIRVDLDAESPVQAITGIAFFDHMLEQLARHGGFSLNLNCQGDVQVDEHHTVEDCALALGEALRKALGTKLGIARYGFLLPMDEAEAIVSVDLSGRAFAQFTGRFPREAVGTLPTELVPHFFRSLAESLGAAIHINVRGENTHHMIEACFKGVGRSLRQAFKIEGRELPSTKGVL
jgi:imidazoleglycerol-phosphate dehydratase/histidinol-phosphatase